MSIATPLGWARAPIVDKDGLPTAAFLKWLQGLGAKVDPTLNLNGTLTSSAQVSGQPAALSDQLQNLDANGIVEAPGVDFTRAYLNKTTDNITDGTGSPLAGGTRGYIALDSDARLASSFYLQPVDASSVPTSASGLTNDGVSHVITVPAQSFTFGFGVVNYSGGTVDPGAFGTWYVYADDPDYTGGAVVLNSTADGTTAKTGSLTRVYFGAIVTTGGTPQTGGGNTGGTTPGGGGGSRGENL